jgi:hypothetical protein
MSRGLKLKRAANVFYWTDSTIVLCWLQRPPNFWKTFVGNRVSEMQLLSCIANWRHVTTDGNPADHISRGLLPAELQPLHQCWHGPEWLQQPAIPYKAFDPTSSDADEKLLEEKQQILVMIAKPADDEAFLRFCAFARLSRVVYVLRFVNNAWRGKESRLSSRLSC